MSEPPQEDTVFTQSQKTMALTVGGSKDFILTLTAGSSVYPVTVSPDGGTVISTTTSYQDNGDIVISITGVSEGIVTLAVQGLISGHELARLKVTVKE